MQPFNLNGVPDLGGGATHVVGFWYEARVAMPSPQLLLFESSLYSGVEIIREYSIAWIDIVSIYCTSASFDSHRVSTSSAPHPNAVPHLSGAAAPCFYARVRHYVQHAWQIRTLVLVSEALAFLCVDAQEYPCTGIGGCAHLRRDLTRKIRSGFQLLQLIGPFST